VGDPFDSRLGLSGSSRRLGAMSDRLGAPPDPLSLLIRLLQDRGGSCDSLTLKWLLEARLGMRIPLESWTAWVQGLAARGVIGYSPEPYGRGKVLLPGCRP
jgi:hypothetical protein